MKVAQLCTTLCYGLEWVAFLFCRGSSQPRDWIQVSHTAGRFFTNWAVREALENHYHMPYTNMQGDQMLLFNCTTGSQPPAHQSTGEGLEGCIRGRRRHPPKVWRPGSQRHQAEPWCEDKPHTGDFCLTVSQALMRLGKGASRRAGLKGSDSKPDFPWNGDQQRREKCPFNSQG